MAWLRARLGGLCLDAERCKKWIFPSQIFNQPMPFSNNPAQIQLIQLPNNHQKQTQPMQNSENMPPDGPSFLGPSYSKGSPHCPGTYLQHLEDEFIGCRSPKVGQDQLATVGQVGNSLGEDPNSDSLNRKGLKDQYCKASNSSLINQAKIYLKENNYNLQTLLSQPDFKDYEKTPDFKTYIRKFINNHSAKPASHASKREIEKSQSSASPLILQPLEQEGLQPQVTQFSTSIGPAKGECEGIFNNGAIFDYMILQEYLKRFIQCDGQQRLDLLRELSTRNSQTLLQFIAQVDSPSYQNLSNGMFGLLNQLLCDFGPLDIDLKSRLFLNSLPFYQGELIQVDQAVLKDAVTLLATQPNVKQMIGLANFIIFTENKDFIKMSPLISKLEASHPGVVLLLKLTWDLLRVDAQVQRLIPNHLFILNQPYLRQLKADHGLALVRDIPAMLTECFNQICGLCAALDDFDLIEYIYETRSTFRQKLEHLHIGSLLSFMKQLGKKLRERDPNWVGQLEKIIWLQRGIITLQTEKGIILEDDQIERTLSGDLAEFNSLLSLPRALKDITITARQDLVNLLEAQYRHCPLIIRYLTESKDQLFETRDSIIQVEQHLGFKLQASQTLCLNMASSFQDKNLFVNFGIGNGKTLLAAMLAICISREQNQHVFIVSKNEHLVLRDCKRFEALFQKLGIKCSYNSWQAKEGISYFTQSALKKQYESSALPKHWCSSVVILDEFDWILFEGVPKSMLQMLELFRSAQRIIGLSGSTLTVKEEGIIKRIFGPLTLQIPSLARLLGDKVQKRKDILVASTKQDYIAELKKIISSHIMMAPVIIVAQDTYKVIEGNLSQGDLDLVSLNRSKAQNIEASLFNRYLLKNKQKAFGVYLMNEAQGRGTDFLTNSEIDESGGPLLIVADAFSERSEEQVRGRVGRMNSNGSWQRVLFAPGIPDSVEQFILVRQNILKMNDDKKLAQLMDQLESTQLSKIAQDSEIGLPKVIKSGAGHSEQNQATSITEGQEMEESDLRPGKVVGRAFPQDQVMLKVDSNATLDGGSKVAGADELQQLFEENQEEAKQCGPMLASQVIPTEKDQKGEINLPTWGTSKIAASAKILVPEAQFQPESKQTMRKNSQCPKRFKKASDKKKLVMIRLRKRTRYESQEKKTSRLQGCEPQSEDSLCSPRPG